MAWSRRRGKRRVMKKRGHLGELIKGLLRQHDLERRVRQHQAMDLWPEVVGADIARNAWPLGVRDGVLLVGVVNHAWAQTLHLMSVVIIEAVNSRLEESALRDLQVRVTGHGHRSRRASGADQDRPRRPSPPALTREEQERVRDLTSGIEDPELKAKVRRAAAGLMRLRRWREAAPQRACARCGRPFSGTGRVCPACARGR